jgi:hypothetical protein
MPYPSHPILLVLKNTEMNFLYFQSGDKSERILELRTKVKKKQNTRIPKKQQKGKHIGRLHLK